MRHERHCSSFLILFIIFVYYLQFKSQELKSDQQGVRDGSSELSWKQFKKISQKLRRQVDNIAARRKHKFYEEEPAKEEVEGSLQQSRTVIYNRIDKAGSTTLISKS